MYRIAYLTSKDPADKRESSGVYYYQSAELKKYSTKFIYLGPVNSLLISLIRKFFNFLRKFLNKKYNHTHSIIISKLYGRIYSKMLKGSEFDFIFADKSSCEIAFLKTDIPVIYSTDATFAQLNNYYPEYSNLFRFSEKESNLIEQKAINLASMVICASGWAANSVVNDYSFPAERVHVIPRGANIDKAPDRNIVLNKLKTEVCRLVFVGKDYKRKGFDIAYRTMDYIRSKNVPVKLVAVGCSPPAEFIDEDVEIVKFIDKNSKEGMEQFDSIMFSSDFYLLPTRAECMGIAFCEAAAYGLPVITTDTGGVTEVVKDGINGYALDYDADHAEYGERILSIYQSDEEYYSLISSSRNYFEKRLNWSVWGKSLKKILDESAFTVNEPESLPGGNTAGKQITIL